LVGVKGLAKLDKSKNEVAREEFNTVFGHKRKE
jgi:hypothetical protein